MISLLLLLSLRLLATTSTAFLIHLQNQHGRSSSLSGAGISTTSLHAMKDDFNSKLYGNNRPQTENAKDPSQSPIPYVIQKIGRGSRREIDELTRLCIDVFFNQQKFDGRASGGQGITPWKAVQLAYLRNSQMGDMLTRNAFRKDKKVDIIIARRVYSVSDNHDKEQVKYVQKNEKIYGKDQLTTTKDLTNLALGEIIGYCEVIEKNFGLGEKMSTGKTVPYLANLSVSKYARQTGVGSKLLEVSEEVALDWKTSQTRMVLQVEEDNTDAIRFYKKRGWTFLYADPTCRRFDTSGFFLKESRITKYAMMKQIRTNNDVDKATKSPVERLKNMWFVSQ